MIRGTFTVHVSGTPSELSDTLSVSTIKIHKLMKFGLTCFAELHGTWPLDDTITLPLLPRKNIPSGFIHPEHGKSCVCENITLSA
jgi:hypothetical protein